VVIPPKKCRLGRGQALSTDPSPSDDSAASRHALPRGFSRKGPLCLPSSHFFEFPPLTRVREPQTLTILCDFSKFSAQYLPQLRSERNKTWQTTRAPDYLGNLKIWWPWDVRCVREGRSKLPILKKFACLAPPSGVMRQHSLSFSFN